MLGGRGLGIGEGVCVFFHYDNTDMAQHDLILGSFLKRCPSCFFASFIRETARLDEGTINK